MAPGNSLIRTERKSGLNQTNFFINYFSFYNLVIINLDKLKNYNIIGDDHQRSVPG